MDVNNKGSTGPEDRVLAELAQLNRQSLELLRAQALSGSFATSRLSLFVEIADLWERLNSAALGRAASCHCLLVDFAFLDARRWTAVGRDLVHDQELMTQIFDVPATDAVARSILTAIWHYSRMREPRLGLFGVSSAMSELIAVCSQTQILRVAEQHRSWLQPRWPQYVWFWRNLLQSALDDDAVALRRTSDQGVSMLATEMRTKAPK